MATKGFRGKFNDIDMDNPVLAPLIGLTVLIFIVFISFYFLG